MGLVKAIKNFKWGYLLISLILSLAGLCFIFYPNQSIKTGSYVIACAALIVGIILVIKVLANRKRSLSFAISVISSVLTITCGVVALIIPEEVFKLYPMFIGLFILIDGSFKLQTVINAKRYQLRMWWFLLIFALITIVGGFLIIRLRVDETVKHVLYSEILGITLFADGLENFFSLFYLGKIESRALEHLKANLEKENEDVFEDASVADSYNIKDDDNVIRVDIIPNGDKKDDSKESSNENSKVKSKVNNKEENTKGKKSPPAIQENNVTVRNESTKPSAAENKNDDSSKNLPVKSNTEIQVNN